MKVLIADFLFAEAHRDVNTNFIYAFTNIGDIDVVSLNGYYEKQRAEFEERNIKLLNITKKRRTGKLGSRLFSLSLMKDTAFYINNASYDAIVCLGFETVFFGLGLVEIRGVPILLFHHKNTDELRSLIKRLAFNTYKNKVYHIVFENFFKNRLVNEIGVLNENVYVVPHPAKIYDTNGISEKYDCVAISNSNDEDFISEAIIRENEFLQHGLHILFRSKTKEKEGAVEVIKGFMEKEKYDELIMEGKTIFVPLPKTFVYRLSASIYDALSRKKTVFTTSKYYADEYEKRYPGICRYVETVDQLIEELGKDRNTNLSSIQRFLEEHSIDAASVCINQIMRELSTKARR